VIFYVYEEFMKCIVDLNG